MSLPVLIIVRFYCSPRLQIMPREGEGAGEGSSQAMSISTQSSSPVSPSIPCFIPPHPQSDCYPGQRVIGISWRIPQHCSPFQAQGDMLMTGSTPLLPYHVSFMGRGQLSLYTFCIIIIFPLPPPHFPFFSSCLRFALLLLFSSLINFSLVFGSHKFQLFSALWHSRQQGTERGKGSACSRRQPGNLIRCCCHKPHQMNVFQVESLEMSFQFQLVVRDVRSTWVPESILKNMTSSWDIPSYWYQNK